MKLRLIVFAAMIASPVSARESLGVFDGWAAFRDSDPRRCYAVAMPEDQDGGTRQPFVTIAWWPQKNVRGQIHFRLRYDRGEGRDVRLHVGNKRWRLMPGKSDAWSPSPQHDAYILAKIRQSGSMTISATGPKGGRFVDSYDLKGAASAMDAAALGCPAPR